MQTPKLSFRTIIPWLTLYLVLSAIPYLTAWLATPADKSFVGALINPDDLPTYLSAMRQGATGSWSFHFTYSPELWQPRIMLLPYISLGKVAGFIGGNFVVWYHLARLGGAFFSLVLLWFWVRGVLPNARQQLTGWLMIVFSAGFGWVVALTASARAPTLAPDLYFPEWTTFMSLLHTPHFALGIGLEVLLFLCAINLVERKDWRWVVPGAVTAVALGLTYVYHITVAGLVIGLFLLGRAYQLGHIPWRSWAYSSIILYPLFLMLIYYAVIANLDPYFATYARVDHVIRPPSPPALFVGVGFIGILALVGLRAWVKAGHTWLVPIWAGANLLLLYTPAVSYSGRFSLGMLIPLNTLAAFGLETAVIPRLSGSRFFATFARLTPTPTATLRRTFLLFVIPSTVILPFWLARGASLQTDFPIYLPRVELEAAVWLGEQVNTGEIVLADYPISNYLPAVMPGKVFAGQLDFTTDLDSKLADVRRFWHEDTPDVWRNEFIQKWGISYIYQGRYENEITVGKVIPPGEVVYDKDGIIIYHIDNGRMNQ